MELLELVYLDASDCNAEKLYTTFRAEMWKKQIPFLNIFALSYDNASVIIGKYKSFKIKSQKTLQKFDNDAMSLSRICISIKCSLQRNS